jgi:hypothetical protein
MSKVLEILKLVKTYFLTAVILFLLVVIYFKNNKIDRLTTQLAEQPTIEYVYQTKTDTITVIKPVPVEVIKYNTKIETSYVPLDLTHSDSATIAQEYIKLNNLYGETKVYDDVLKDDSIAFIQLQEKVQFNEIKDRNLIFLDRTPIVYITNTKVINKQLVSIVGGLDATFSKDFGGVSVGIGLITKKNAFFKVGYDPFNQATTGGVFLPIFNFNK